MMIDTIRNNGKLKLIYDYKWDRYFILERKWLFSWHMKPSGPDGFGFDHNEEDKAIHTYNLMVTQNSLAKCGVSLI